MRRLRFNGTGGRGTGCPSVHEHLDKSEDLFRTFKHTVWQLETRLR